MLYDIAFMGGGVRGIGFAGVVKALDEFKYMPRRAAGTSAGAIAAALLAAGYSGREMYQALQGLDFLRFRTKSRRFFGFAREFFYLRRNLGIYSADYFEEWFDTLLRRKGKTVFGDLEGGIGYKLQLTASDIQNKRLLVLPQDLKLFGLEPQNYSIAKAVRMSMSIPLFYEPYRLKDSAGQKHLIADGGLFCNYPIWLLDDGCKKKTIPVFGAKFAECENDNKRMNPKFFRLTNYFKQVLGAVLDAQGHGYARITKGDTERTISISVCADGKNISSANFDLDEKTAVLLLKNGYDSASDFLKKWDFDKWLSLRS